MSDNDVTVEKVEAELFKIVQGMIGPSADVATGRVEAAKLLLARLDQRNRREQHSG